MTCVTFARSLTVGSSAAGLELQGKLRVKFLANVNSRSRSLYAVARPSVCLSVTLVHPTQAVVIFRNISTAFGTLAIR